MTKRPEWWQRRHLLIALGLGLLAALVYLPVLNNEFVNFDDVYYIQNNPQIAQLDAVSLRSYFTTFYFGNYQPLTLISLALDYQRGGPDPQVFHLGNLLLHMLNTVLVFWFVGSLLQRRYRYTGASAAWQPLAVALVSAALFAVHPMHVESVAWAAQRKDVLYTAFYLASLIAYLGYTNARRPGLYLASLLLFGCSVLSKAMAVSLFASLLAIDFYLGRLDRKKDTGRMAFGAQVKEKGPFLVVALTFGILATIAQKSSSFMAHSSLHTVWQQALYASYGFMQYLAKLIAPTGLSAYYPYPDPAALPIVVWLSPVVGIGTLFWLVRSYRRHATAAFGLLFFLVNIGPVLQLIPIGNFVMADRFAYLSSLGIFIMLGSAFVALIERRAGLGKILIGGGVAYVFLLGFLTVQRVDVWRDSLALWNDVLGKYPDISLALSNRGIARGQAGDLDGALADFDRSVALAPDYADAYCNRGMVRFSTKDYTAAIADFGLALQNQPDHRQASAQIIRAHFYRGAQRAAAGDNKGAMSDFAYVVGADPDYPNAANNLRVVRQRLGH